MRIKFRKDFQRKFLQEVLIKINCPTIKELSNRISINYSTLKNYFIEDRLFSEEILNRLCEISGIEKSKLNFKILDENWGKIKGGKN